MLQENHTFDNYFGMLNPYRHANGWDIGDDGKEYDVDGIDDKLSTISNEDDEGTVYNLYKFRTTCIDDDSSDWLASYGDVNRYNFLPPRGPSRWTDLSTPRRDMPSSCSLAEPAAAIIPIPTGERAMGYYDQDFLNYYYYMASQFAVSDRWFSPVSSKSVPNRIATFTGGTTQGLVYRSRQRRSPTPAQHQQHLRGAGQGWSFRGRSITPSPGRTAWRKTIVPGQVAPCILPDTTFLSNLSYSTHYLYENPSKAACKAPTQPSSVVGDPSNSFCIDPTHVAPLSQYYSD